MVPDTAGELLPPLYAKWIAELLGGPIPREARATCAECAMCARPEEDSAAEVYFFDSVIKCCTYIPDLHNFLVGRILTDSDPDAKAGQATVWKRIADAIGVTPLGLTQSPVYSLLYRTSSKSFGRSRALRCPHYLEDGGRCGVWRNRESTCATWFCKHVRGQVGYTFWRESLHRVLLTVERDLARWCVLELQLGDEALRHLVNTAGWSYDDEAISGHSLDSKIDQYAYSRIWGEWRGREHEFFVRCAGLVSPLSWADVLAISGPEARAFARLTQEAYDRLISDDIPPALNVGPFHLVQIQNAMTRVNTYSESDPLDVPNIVMELLQYFDGRPTEDALAAIAEERGVRVDPALVRKMVDFRLLIPLRSGAMSPSTAR